MNEKIEITEAEQLIKDINDLKKNMVPKTDYDKVVADNEKFKHALLNGTLDTEPEPLKSSEELKKEYSEAVKKGVTNVKGFETVLKLRQAVINETGTDPFMTEALTKIDPNFGERVAENISNILEQSEGSPQMFNAIMSQNLK